MTERALAEGQDSGPYPATKQPCGLRKPAFPFWDSVSPYVAAWNWTVGLSYPTFYGSMKSSKADHSPVDLNISSELLMCSWNIDSLWSFVFPASPPHFLSTWQRTICIPHVLNEMEMDKLHSLKSPDF